MPRLQTFLLFAVIVLTTQPATASDIHQLWDQRCGGCHGHAGPFARKSLVVVDGKLRGRYDGRDISALLVTHNGGYSAKDINAIHSMLMAQATTLALFNAKCGNCHQTAAQLAREQLVSRDGQLYGRYSHRPMADFLPQHRQLKPEESALLLDVLIRIEGEVHQP